MIQNYIDLKKINFLIFISFFPNFIFRSNLNFDEIIYTLIIFITPILFINYFLIKKNIFNNFFFSFYIAILIIFGIDNHLGLWNGFILPFKHDFIDFFGILYIPGIILFLTLSLVTGYLILIGMRYSLLMMDLLMDQTK